MSVHPIIVDRSLLATIVVSAAFGLSHSVAHADDKVFLPVAIRGVSIGSGQVLDPIASFEVDASAIAAATDRLYLAQDHAVVVYDTSEPSRYTEIGRSVRLPQTPLDLDIGPRTICAALGPHGVALFDVITAASPTLYRQIGVDGVAEAVSCRETFVFVAVDGVGLQIFQPHRYGMLHIATVPLDGPVRSIDVNEGWAVIGPDVDFLLPAVDFLLPAYGPVQLIDVTNPSAPQLAGEVEGFSGHVVGEALFVGRADSIHVYDISDPDSPRRIEDADLHIIGDRRRPGYEHLFRSLKSLGGVLYAGTHSGVVAVNIEDPWRPEIKSFTKCRTFGKAAGLSVSSSGEGLSVGIFRLNATDVCSFEVQEDRALVPSGQITIAPGALIGVLDGSPLLKLPASPGELYGDDRRVAGGIIALDPDRAGSEHRAGGSLIPAFHALQSIVVSGRRAVGVRYGAGSDGPGRARAIEVVTFDVSAGREPEALGVVTLEHSDAPPLVSPDGRTAILPLPSRWPDGPKLAVLNVDAEGIPSVVAHMTHVGTYGGIMAPGLAVLHAGATADGDTRFALIDVSEPEAPTLRLERYGGSDAEIKSFAWAVDALFVSGSDGTLVLDVADPSAVRALGRLHGDAWTGASLRHVSLNTIASEYGDGVRIFDVSRPLEPLAIGRIQHNDPATSVLNASDGWISTVSGFGTGDSVTSWLYRLRPERP